MREILTRSCLAQLLHGLGDQIAFLLADLVSCDRQCRFDGHHHLICFDLCFHPGALVHVFERVLERISQHFLHCFIRDIDRASQLQPPFRTRFRVPRQHLQNTIGIDFKLYSHARHAFRRGLELNLKLAERPVVLRHLALALQHFDRHRALIIHRRGKHFARLNRNSGVPRNNDIHEPAERFNSERQWRNVQEHDIAKRTR